jgi:hypothetical protein
VFVIIVILVMFCSGVICDVIGVGNEILGNTEVTERDQTDRQHPPFMPFVHYISRCLPSFMPTRYHLITGNSI